MSGKKQLCIVGGGPSGVGLLWTLAQDPGICAEWAVTIIHDQDHWGGHCLTFDVTNPNTGKPVAVDIGVQFVTALANPNVAVMLESGDFPTAAPLVDAPPLTVGAAFPRRNGLPMNWGNFPAYQTGDQFQLWHETGMAQNCEELQAFIAISPLLGYGGRPLGQYLQDAGSGPLKTPFTDLQDFEDYFVDPYMTIINGYGKPDLDSVVLGELLPIFGRVPGFPGPLASWTEPGLGWKRFAQGTSSWVEAMYAAAAKTIEVTEYLSSSVSDVWIDGDDPGGQVGVAWSTEPAGQPLFDKVVLTTDMATNHALLSTARNKAHWAIYESMLDPSNWPLQDGTCYIHADASILSPDLTQQEEVAQFTAYYATGDTPFNQDATYTSYLIENVQADPDAAGLFVTMYGPVTPDTRLPADDKVLAKQTFKHGMWLPTYMGAAKKKVHTIQGQGSVPGGTTVPNAGTNLYFAGNNLTNDSVEGALVSAMVVANYAFSAPYPLPMAKLTPVAFAMFTYLYLDYMFPVTDGTKRTKVIGSLKAAAAPTS